MGSGFSPQMGAWRTPDWCSSSIVYERFTTYMSICHLVASATTAEQVREAWREAFVEQAWQLNMAMRGELIGKA